MPPGFWQAGFVALWHPGVMLVVVVVGGAYLMATLGPWRRHFPGAAAVPRRQTAFFLGGLLAMYLAVGTPLDLLSDRYLFSAHMLEHVLLVFALDPLVLLGTPAWLVRPVLRHPVTGPILRRLTRPLTALALFLLTFSLAHVPYFYDLTLTNQTLHFCEHAVFTFTGLLLWWPLLSPLPEVPRLSDPLQIGYIFLNEIGMTVAFALITFAHHPLYLFYTHAPRVLGISHLEDEQLGGIIMRMGSMSVFFPVAFAAFFRWARSETRRASRIDPAPRPLPLPSTPIALEPRSEAGVEQPAG